LIEILTIAVFAALQSVFGIGILFLGTPTLLILGYSFPDTLSIVLPASIAVSLLQVLRGVLPAKQWIGEFALWCMLPLGVVLVVGLSTGLDVELELFVALMLLAYVAIRLLPSSGKYLEDNVRRFPRIWLSVIGIVHGLSNLGGGLLAIFAASTFTDKVAIRGRIAFCYLCFAGIQLSVLALLTPEVMHFGQLGYAVLAGVIFIFIERHVFDSITSPVFDRVFTILICGYSTVLFLRLFGAFGAA
jgi:uncharacterized membrane protein YfcA